MRGLLLRADGILRRHRWTTQSERPWRATGHLLASLVLFGGLYGGVMGSFGILAGQERWLLQTAYSAIKVPLLLTATFLLSIPSFFVLNTLLGLRREFPQAFQALLAAQAAVAIILASLAPFTLLSYASSADYPRAVLFNALMFAVASLTAQWLLRGYYRPLVASNAKHRWLLWAWIFVYAFIGIQMGWVMRPFVGSAEQAVEFFREDAWDNAYVRVARIMWAASQE